ncbi:hypothetical protein HMPREF0870_01956 [Veillonella atypica KON]|uniref:Uncharacterized protein n=1 Tax=Veillonella atypica KON TaxID=1128111 RepID=A0ABP2SPQ1_9FIRM|nr:hypothetical protein HMPREF0870_01956 [Veillonella atypica KON]
MISVPIRGLFNLTLLRGNYDDWIYASGISVPIRGLFNLTCQKKIKQSYYTIEISFRPHQGII